MFENLSVEVLNNLIVDAERRIMLSTDKDYIKQQNDFIKKCENALELKEKNDFNIWCEGYNITGQSSGANFLGKSKGKDLKDACINFAKNNREFSSYFDEKRMTYWGCRIFDNETDARIAFG